MYPRKSFYLSKPSLKVQFGNRQAEYLKQHKSFIVMYSDADLDRELRKKRSTTSIAFLTNVVVTHWDISKQGKPTGATTSGTAKAITLDRVKISSFIYQKQKGSIQVEHSKTELMLADPNTKPHGGKTVADKIHRLIGTRFIPQKTQSIMTFYLMHQRSPLID
eukprot:6948181-Ditylum_brightwellii.AAC.1